MRCWAVDEEVGRQRHGLPRHHERIGVVSEQHEAHAGQEQVVLEAEQPGRGPLALAKIAGGEQRNACRSTAQQHQEYAGQGIPAQVERQVGQADGQHGLFRWQPEADPRHDGQREAAKGPEWKQRASGESHAHGARQPQCTDGHPGGQQGQAGIQR